MTLALARAEAQAHRDLLDRGVDPRTARRARRPAPLSDAASPNDKHSIEFLAHEFLAWRGSESRSISQSVCSTTRANAWKPLTTSTTTSKRSARRSTSGRNISQGFAATRRSQ